MVYFKEALMYRLLATAIATAALFGGVVASASAQDPGNGKADCAPLAGANLFITPGTFFFSVPAGEGKDAVANRVCDHPGNRPFDPF
jgi:hypothetical protein